MGVGVVGAGATEVTGGGGGGAVIGRRPCQWPKAVRIGALESACRSRSLFAASQLPDLHEL